MAKPKVFTWSDGFHAYTVAVTSRAKALAAWGVARDLFEDGEAKEITQGADHDAALAAPGETIRRGLSVDVGKVSPVAKPKPAKAADVERVAALELELDDLRAAHDAAAARFEAERKRLADEEAASDASFETRSETLSKRLAAARKRLRR